VARAGRGSLHRRRRVLRQPARTTSHARDAPRNCYVLFQPHFSRSRRADELRNRCCGRVSPSRRLYGPNPQG
jgi:hypothetical protein